MGPDSPDAPNSEPGGVTPLLQATRPEDGRAGFEMDEGEVERTTLVPDVAVVQGTNGGGLGLSSLRQDGQPGLVLSLPMPETKCPHCEEYFVNPGPFDRHLKAAGYPVNWVCNICHNYSGTTFMGAAIHKGRCKGENSRPTPVLRPWACSEQGCGQSFDSKIGLGQHVRLEHPVVACRKRSEAAGREAEQKRDQRSSVRVQARPIVQWSVEDVARLKSAHKAASLAGVRYINRAVTEAMGGQYDKRAVADKIRGLGLRGHVYDTPTSDPYTGVEDRLGSNPSDSVMEAEVPESEEPDSRSNPSEGNEEEEVDEVEPMEDKREVLRAAAELLQPELEKTSTGEEILQLLNAAVENGVPAVKQRVEAMTEALIKKWSETDTPNETSERSHQRRDGRSGTDRRNRRPGPKSREKRERYRLHQKMFSNNRRELVEMLINDKEKSGGCPITRDTVESVYKERFRSQVLEVDLSGFPRPDGSISHDIMNNYITPAEVCRSFAGMRAQTAAGPDGITLSTVKKADSSGTILAGLFNLWYVGEMIPKVVGKNRSILLPKKSPESTDINDWRPLTIASVLLRGFSKIIASRMGVATPLNPRQRGFIKGASGCAENLNTLRALIEDGKRNSRGVAVALLDLAKAFDKVPHALLIAGLKRFGANPRLVGTVKALYSNAVTYFKVAGGNTEEIAIEAGVAQGSPLSPILFNIAMDPLFCLLESEGCGYGRTRRERITSLAYADDTAVISDNRDGLAQNLKLVEKFCASTGLVINVRKSFAFVIKRRGRSFTLNNNDQLILGGQPIPWVGPEDTTRYLGGAVSGWTQKSNRQNMAQLSAWLVGLHKGALKPWQKLQLLRDSVLPKVVYGLASQEKTGATALRSLDKIVRKWVKRWAHLPDDVTSDFLHSPFKNGGLAIPELVIEIPLMRIRNYQACLRSTDEAIREIASRHDFKSKSGKCGSMDARVQSVLDQKHPRAKINHQRSVTWACRISQGKGVTTWRQCQVSNGWLKGGKGTIIKPCEWGDAMKLRTNTYPTREYLLRGKTVGPDIKCRACHRDVETIGHISGKCPRVKIERIARHDQIVDRLEAFARRKGYRTVKEPNITGTDGSRYRPDLLLSKDGTTIIADPTVVWDGGGNLLDAAAQTKLRKYGNITEPVKQLTGSTNAMVCPLVVGCRGSWARANQRLVTELGLTKSWISQTCEIALARTVWLVKTFMDL